MKLKIIIIIVAALLMVLLIRGGARTGTTLINPPWNHCLGLDKVTQFHLNLYSCYREKFHDPRGLFCTKLICEDDTSTNHDDDELTVFGLNSGNSELIYNRGMTSINVVGKEGDGEIDLDHPLDISGDSRGNIYIADTGNNRIIHLEYSGGEVELAGVLGEDYLHHPSSLSCSGDLIYVADTGNDRIAVINRQGELTETVDLRGKNMRLQAPTAIEVISRGDDWLYYEDYFIALIDSSGQRLWKLDNNGGILGIAYHSKLGSGTFSHLDIDYYGNIYVTDTVQNRIHKFDRHLNYLVAIGERDRIELDQPRGISIYRRFGQVFVSERSGARYFWVGTDIIRLVAESIAVDQKSGRCIVDISFILTEHSYVSMWLESKGGEKMLELLSDYLFPPGCIKKRIEVTSPELQQIGRQKIRVVVTAKPTYSSHSYCTIEKRSNLLQPVHTISGR